MVAIRFGEGSGGRRGAVALRLVLLGVVTGLTVVSVSSPAAAHDGIVSSEPASGSVIEQPIDSVTIDFGAEIGDSAQIAVLGPDGQQITSTTTATSSSTATTEFEMLEDEGPYTVNYLATSVVDGHVLGGAISFTYGDDDGTADTMSPVLFGAIAAVILGIGAWFSWRARQRARVDDDEDIAAVDVT
jgi:methionine-rich copper-binding protein CopC